MALDIINRNQWYAVTIQDGEGNARVGLTGMAAQISDETITNDVDGQYSQQRLPRVFSFRRLPSLAAMSVGDCILFRGTQYAVTAIRQTPQRYDAITEGTT